VKIPVAERTLLEGILYYLSILLKFRGLIIGVTAAAAVGVLAFCIVSIRLPPEKSPLPNTYTAEAVILVERGAQGALAASILSSLGIAETSAANATTGYDNAALLIMILHSRTFVDKIVEEFDLINKYKITEQEKSRSREFFQGNTVTTYDRTTGSITISFSDIDPVFAKDVTNRMVSLLNEWYSQNMGSSNIKQKKLLEDKVKEVKVEIDALEKRLKALQNKYGVLTAQELGTSQAAALAELRSQLILKEIDIKNYSTFTAIEDPKMQQLREERQNILDLIAKIQTGVSNVQDVASEQRNLPEVEMEFNNLTVELDVQRRIYNTLSHQYEVLKLTAEPEQAFQILELAEVPDAKSGPQRMMIVMAGTMIGFIASVVLAFLLNSLAQTRKKVEESTAVKKDVP
jgi:tyrosine-protein kinase Etk/Wzc